MTEDILSLLDGKWEEGTRPADLYERVVAKRPGNYVDILLEGLASKKKRQKAGCAEIASRLSADHPRLLYPHVDVFLRHLRAREPVLRWEAVCTLGNLSHADDDKVIPRHLTEIIELLADKSIVLQGHAVRALAKVAKANPGSAARILAALFDAVRFFPGTRVGYVVEATEMFAEHDALSPKLREFLARYVESEHAPVARKAKKALKGMGTRK